MNMFLNQIRKISRYFLFKFNKPMIRNKEFCLISNNCIAGLIYHDLSLEFKSPIINMFIRANDYILFLNNIDYYLTEELIESNSNENDYPIGTIGKAGKMITLHFLHYEDFNQAKIKWDSRKKKVNKENIFVLAEYLPEDGWTNKILERFEDIPYLRKKIIISSSLKDEISIRSSDIIYVEGSNFANWKTSTWRIWEKGYDDCNLIEWIDSN